MGGLSMLKNGTFVIESDDMQRFADIARERRSNSSALLRKVIAAWIARVEPVEQKKAKPAA